MADQPQFDKCRMCGIPLNSEIRSESDPTLCFECAEETRKFTIQPEEQAKTKAEGTKSKKKSWFKALFGG